ncbi:MAG: MFS transporter [Lentisphaeria bacterium]|nr:MFS transporter [Lentisphaeria bacterium]
MKYLFYLLPGVLNLVIGLFFFITAKRMADANLSSLAVTATMPMWALIYALSSFTVGKYCTRQNAVKILFVSQVILLFSMLGLLFTPAVKLQYLWLLVSGLGTGLFFTPFQTVVKLFEKVEISPETFSKSAATYVFSWSFGQGCGPMVAALVWGAFDPVNGWKYCYVINILVVIWVLVSLIFMQKFIRRRLQEIGDSATESADAAASASSTGLPDVMKSAWILAFGGFLAIAVLRSYLPDYATKVLHFPTSAQGIMLALVSIVQAFMALCCFRAKRFPFKPWAGLFTGGCACIALGMLIFCTSNIAAWGATALFGVFSGVFCFNLTYHALANYTKSAQYAAVNETIVGGTAVFAPIAAGLIADHTTAQMPFYMLIAILIITTGIFCKQTWQYRNF